LITTRGSREKKQQSLKTQTAGQMSWLKKVKGCVGVVIIAIFVAVMLCRDL